MFPFKSFHEHSVKTLLQEYDYVIIGGGTAGCVIANRLSTNGCTVLLVERGGVGDSWISRIPLLSQPFQTNDSRVSTLKSVPQKHLNNRVFDIMSGNSLGGGTKINALLYTRGIPAEYNAWHASGRKGWSYDELKPLFVKSETDLDQNQQADGFHGITGEWINRSHKENYWGHTPFVAQACSNLDIPYVHDLNSPLHPAQGCAKMHYNIDARGHRSSTLTAFLPHDLVSKRHHCLHVCTGTCIEKIEIAAEPAGLRARGVTLRALDSSLGSCYVKARREVIVCAGSLGSPQALMLSGIGPAAHLKQFGISTVKDLPGVGSNLQDHAGVPLQFMVPMKDSVVKLAVWPWTIIWELLRYLFYGTGLLLAQTLELSIFIQTRLFDEKANPVGSTPTDLDAALPENLPDIEIMPIAWGVPSEYKVFGPGGMALFILNLRPTSRGTVKLASSNPLQCPIVDLGAFSTEDDWKIIRNGLKLGMRVQQEMASLGYPIFKQHVPMSFSNEDVDIFIRKYCMTTYHYSSTCRMAPEDELGVVDDQLCVYGVQGLRVADASIFPQIPGTHLAAPTVVVAEKCAAMIKEKYGDA